MKHERIYYRVNPDSPVMQVFEKVLEKQRIFGAACAKLRAEYPGATVWTYGSSQVSGLAFHGPIPTGWRESKKEGYAVPDKRTAAGRDVARRLKAMPQSWDGMWFSDELARTLKVSDPEAFIEWGDGKMYWSVPEQHGDVLVLSVPLACKVVPPGCTELKMSEYWAIREKAQKKDEGAAA